MLSLLPELLFLAPLSAFIIRVVVGISLGIVAYRHILVPTTILRVIGIIEGVTALLLIVGAYTQGAAIVAFLLIGTSIFLPAWRKFPRSTLLLLGILSFSLILTGAGPFAFDLPL